MTFSCDFLKCHKNVFVVCLLIYRPIVFVISFKLDVAPIAEVIGVPYEMNNFGEE